MNKKTDKKTPLNEPSLRSEAGHKKRELVTKPRGMRDLLPSEYESRKKFVEKAEAIVSYYNFEPIQTPHLEKLELFTTTVGEYTDIVEKEMYNLKTKGGDRLVLRPEGTAPIVRAYLEHGMQSKPQPVMLYYHGSFFRHERPQKGRKREFQQFGLEILGEKDAIADAIIIKVALVILEEAAGLKPISIHLNSIGCNECRKIYQKELVAFYRKIRTLCKNCDNRLKTNPLRLLDCKEEKCIEIKKRAPQIINYLCGECTRHFKELLEILDISKIPYYIDHYLVRGLDYYSRTAFEFYLEENLSELAGGGRYDSLATILSGREVPGVGMAMGIERIMGTIAEKKDSTVTPKMPKIFFIQLGASAKHKSLYILEILRKAKISTKHSLSKNSIKAQLKIIDKLKIPYALILGQKEVLENNIILRDMKTSSQETISLEKLIDHLKNKIK